MNYQVRILSLISAPLFFVSCTPSTQQSGAGGVYQDPNNPYAVPGVTTQGGGVAQAPYQAPATSAPYQPIPTTPINPPATLSDPGYTSVPTIPTAPSGGGGSSHVVTSGDTLWGLGRKYNVSADQIRQANGISGDTIVTGQTLTIPQ